MYQNQTIARIIEIHCIGSMKSILITLVHYNNVERTKTARKVIRDLADLIGDQFNVAISEVSYQPASSPVSIAVARQKALLFRKVVRQWDTYMGNDQPLWWAEMYYFLAHMVRHHVFAPYMTKNRRLQIAQELSITNKHLMAWNCFLESGKDLLLVFEDDVILDPDQLPEIKHFFSQLNKLQMDQSEPLYIDVAGGMSQDQLHAYHLKVSSENGMDAYSKPITNTVCGYMMNARLAGIFLGILIRNPDLRLLNADWLVNRLFIMMERMGVSCTCIHANPSIFIHGSISNVYRSWLSDEKTV